MNNTTLMHIINKLCTETNNSRERRISVSVQLGVLRKAFGLKNDDHLKTKSDHRLQPVLTQEEIKNEALWYSEIFQLQQKNDQHEKLRETFIGLLATIDAIEIFDKDLALNIKSELNTILRTGATVK
ncbi:hypothetical protein AYO36_15885 [Exiguobacterium sp. KKBO11]|uniref:hypothetical protein n=1 Tax=Exiguobacterium sp. KKBO11 TaxID=1805000 RepID=UPI0007D88140|nr:hypothetical protein [Exiguobacterium sp. KKBO11]OAI82165.1 hypothetical protein AYO36_15885 [Exiguobacterium sp. KKBO11]